MSYTPTPWATEKRGDNHWIYSDCEDWRSIADVHSDENAEFIVKCVNAHDDLVMALQQAQAWLERVMACAGGGDDVPDADYAAHWNAVNEQMVAALTKAGAVS